MKDKEMVLLPFAVVLLLSYVLCEGCIFPKEMYDTERPWRILTRDFSVPKYHQYRRLNFKVSDMFSLEYMAGKTGDNAVKTVTYRCVEEGDDRKYLVKRESEGDKDTYQCIQFLLRNQNTVQWKVSGESSEIDYSACDDEQLNLMDDPLIYYYRNGFWREERNRNMTYDPCPIDGGYLLDWKDPLTQLNLCNSHIPPLKIENRCTNGQGLRFYSAEKDTNCVGKDAENLGVEFLCLGHWDEGAHSFMLIGQLNEDRDHIYCLRLPQDRKDQFNGHIFLDTICDSTEAISNSRDYREISMKKHVVKSLCSDETPECVQYNNEDCDLTKAASCRKACSVCEDDEDIGEQNVFFPEQFMGEWLKHTDRLGRETVTIFSRSIKIPSLSRYSILGESACGRKVNENAKHKSYEYIMATSFSNGCSPQYVAMVITNRSSSVLSYTISQSRMLDLSIDVDDDLELVVNNNVWGYECSNMVYSADVDPIYDTYLPYKGGWFNLVRTDSKAPSVPCLFPINETYSYITFISSDNANCTGWITSSESKPNEITIYIDNCISSGEADSVTLSKHTFTYTCLANFESDEGVDSPERNMLITVAKEQSMVSQEIYQCWVFIPERLLAYWVPVSECDSNTVHHIEAKFKMPTATVTFASHAHRMQYPFVPSFVVSMFALFVSTSL